MVTCHLTCKIDSNILLIDIKLKQYWLKKFLQLTEDPWFESPTNFDISIKSAHLITIILHLLTNLINFSLESHK